MKKEIRFMGVTYTKESLEQMSVDELDDLLSDLQEELSSISYRLKSARGNYAATGESADWEWYNSTEYALRILEALKQRAARARKNKKDKSPLRLPQYFMDVAEEILDAESFDAVKSEAIERQARDKGAVT